MRLITSEDKIRSLINVSDNIDSKSVLYAIREAQDVDLVAILGTKMVDYLKTNRDTLDDKYKQLINQVQLYLAYSTQVILIENEMVKISNMGVYQASDTNIRPLSISDVMKVKGIYVDKQSVEAQKLQQYCLERYNDFKQQLECNEWFQTKANLQSNATTALWLGGVRGK